MPLREVSWTANRSQTHADTGNSKMTAYIGDYYGRIHKRGSHAVLFLCSEMASRQSVNQWATLRARTLPLHKGFTVVSAATCDGLLYGKGAHRSQWQIQFCMVDPNICGSSLWNGPWQRSRYRNSLRPRRSRDRIPVGARFTVTIQTGPRSHSASCKMGTRSLSQG
jgi:hypothetical protein